MHQVLVEQLGMYSRELRDLERVSPIDDAQWVSEDLRGNQERERKEIKEQIVEEARCLEDSKASYQNLTDDLQRSEIITKDAVGVIASAELQLLRHKL